MAVKPQIEVARGNARVGNGVGRFEGQGGLVVLDGLVKFLYARELVVVKPPVQIQLVSFGIIGVAFEGRALLFAKQLDFDGFQNGQGDLILDVKNVLQICLLYTSRCV